MSERTMYLRVPPTTADEMQATIFGPLGDDGLFDPEHEEWTPRLGALAEAWREQRRFSYGVRLELNAEAAAEMLVQLAGTEGIVETAASQNDPYYPTPHAAQAAGMLQSWRAKQRKLREWLEDEVGATVEGGWGRLPRVKLPEENTTARG